MSLTEPLKERVEKRLDPTDGQVYTFEEIRNWYKQNGMSEADIQQHWNEDCLLTGLYFMHKNIPQWSPGEQVPSWAYDHEAAGKLAIWERQKDCKGAMFMIEGCMAPAWRWALLAVLLLWSYWAVIPIISYKFSTCVEQDLAKISPLIFVTYIPVLLVSLALEVKSFKYVVIATCRHVPTPKSFGKPLTFRRWFWLNLLISASSHMDLATNGIFVGRMLKTSACPESSAIETTWEEVIRQSAFAPISGLVPTLGFFSILTWIAMVLQLAVGLLYSVPVKKVDDKHHSCCDLCCLGQPVQRKMQRMTTRLGLLNPGDAVMALAQIGRMNLLGGRQFEINNANRGPNMGKSAETRKNWALYIQKITLLTSFVLLCENATMANLQATLLGIGKATGQDVDAITFFSVILTLFTAMSTWFATAQIVNRMTRVWRKTHGQVSDYLKQVDKKNVEKHAELDKEGARVVRRSVCIFTLCSCMMIFLLAYAGVKVVMAVWFCDQGVWNMHGCAHIS